MSANIVTKVLNKLRLYFIYCVVNAKRFLAVTFGSPRNAWGRQLIDDGFVKIPDYEKSKGLSDYLNPVIKNYLETGNCAEDVRMKTFQDREYGVKTIAIDLNSPFLFKYVFSKELYDAIYSYFGRPYYLRNNPIIQFGYPEDPFYGAQLFHCDWGLRQVTIMISLHDLELSNMHMEYLTGSNRRYYFSHPNPEAEEFQRSAREYMEQYPERLQTTCGSKDTLSIFDAGNGYHRQMPGGHRVILAMNFVDNLSFTYWKEDWDPVVKDQDYSFSNPHDYFFSEPSPELEAMIRESGIPQDFFSLVFKKIPPGMGVPRLLSSAR